MLPTVLALRCLGGIRLDVLLLPAAQDAQLAQCDEEAAEQLRALQILQGSGPTSAM